MTSTPVIATSRPGACRPAPAGGALAALVLGLTVAVVAMHILVLGGVSPMARPGQMPMVEAMGAPAMPTGARGAAVVAARATCLPAARPVPTVGHPMGGCSNHPCVSTRTEATLAPAVTTSVSPRWPRAAAAGFRPAHRTSRAPPRDGPGAPLCVWRV